MTSQNFFELLLGLSGRLIKLAFGLFLVGSGIAVSLTIFAAPIGIPIILFGILILIRAFRIEPADDPQTVEGPS